MSEPLTPRRLGTTRYDILPLTAVRRRVYRHTIIFSTPTITYLMTMPTGAVWAIDAAIADNDIALDHALAQIGDLLP